MNQAKGFQAFCDYIRGKSVALIGAGVSNMPLIPFLQSCGARLISLRDLKKSSEDPSIKEALSLGAKICLGEGYLDSLDEDVVIRSPGIRPDHPRFLEAKDKGAEITCETELFLRFVPCLSIGITGSDGKTTTTTLILEILKASGWKVTLGGNIGKSMLPQLKEISKENSVCVMELSSFQLMNCKYSPDISVITNLSENHLDWHKDMDEYLKAKKNIFASAGATSVTVLNFDNPYTRSCKPIGEVRWFSSEKKVERGCYIRDSKILYTDGKSEEMILPLDDIHLPGHHNVENYMTAISATATLAKPDAVRFVAKTFGGVPHRIQRIRTLNGVTYYNSSIDSSPARSTAALKAFDRPLIMIAGGYDKNLDYTPLGSVICDHVKVLILCGATADKIESAVRGAQNFNPSKLLILRAECFEETVSLARDHAKHGDQVILSPASASFDLFKNFEERGNRFIQLVQELK